MFVLPPKVLSAPSAPVVWGAPGRVRDQIHRKRLTFESSANIVIALWIKNKMSNFHVCYLKQKKDFFE